MDNNTFTENLNFDFKKIKVIDLYLTHTHNDEITLPKKNWSNIEIELFKTSILNSDLLNNFENLTHLNLTSLKIIEYPDISKLKNLKELEHIGGKFNLPESIGECKSLKKIFISHVGLTKIPKSFKMLEELEDLTISHSNLKNIQNITSVKNLKKLNLSFNKIEKIPENINDLNNLEELDLSWNKLNHLPNDVYNLNSLKKCIFSENPLFNMSTNNIIWQNLKYLDISVTPFACLKKNIEEVKLKLPSCDIKGGNRSGSYYNKGDKSFYLSSINRYLNDTDFILDEVIT